MDVYFADTSSKCIPPRPFRQGSTTLGYMVEHQVTVHLYLGYVWGVCSEFVRVEGSQASLAWDRCLYGASEGKVCTWGVCKVSLGHRRGVPVWPCMPSKGKHRPCPVGTTTPRRRRL